MTPILAALAFQAAGPAPDAASPLALYAEARAIAGVEGERVWPGLADAPFQILLIDGETETLVCGEGAGEGFTPAGTDPATGCDTATRDRQFPANFLASFPAIDGIPTIVVGTPEATGKSPSGWMFTLLHEHFHQMQDARPGAHEGALALDLHDGDTSGMWMLNYPFPYDDPEVGEALRAWADAAAAALEADDSAFPAAHAVYRQARADFMASVSERDARYYEFQMWKEGAARWTEYELARLSGRQRQVGEEWQRMLQELADMDLAGWRRVTVYALGAADAHLLERAGAAWRETYWSEPFSLARQPVR